MNEIEVPESSVLAYRLANGTYVLIHQSSHLLSDKDLEEGVLGVCLDGAEIRQPAEGFEAHNTDDSFSIAHISKQSTGDAQRKDEEEGQETAVVGTQLESGGQDLSLVTLANLTSDLKPKDEKEVQEGAVILEKIEDFVELVTSYRCRICPFTAPNQNELVQHFRLQHAQIKLNDSFQHAETSEISEVPTLLPTPDDVDTDANNSTTINTVHPVSEKLVFLCGQCNEGFASLEECKQHMMQDHDLIVYENSKANEEEKSSLVNQEQELDDAVVAEGSLTPGSAVDSQQINSDIPTTGKSKGRIPQTLEKEYLLKKKQAKSVAGSDKLKCTERGCQYKFSSEETLHMHILCHGTSPEKTNPSIRKDFACYVCGERFEKWRNCAIHLWKAHELDIDLLSCPICHAYKTVTAVKLETHLKIHGEARAYTCPECGKGFKQPSQLRNHRVMHLDRRAGPVPRWYASRRCDICFKSYADSKCLKKHIQAVHSKLRPYVCQVCGHASARKAMLQMHLRQHTGEKPYSCTLCDYRTGDHNSLRRHIMRHTGHRPYRCPHCDYSAIQTNSYKNHLRSKHPGMQGLYNCTKCPFRTVSQESFLQHMSDHKNGLISSTPTEGGAEVFPENVAAAQLIYQSLNAFSADGSPLQVNVTSSATSEDGTTQTITIQIPTQQDTGTELEEDDETPHCFLAIQQEEEEEGVDTGGITIPAEPDPVPLLEGS